MAQQTLIFTGTLGALRCRYVEILPTYHITWTNGTQCAVRSLRRKPLVSPSTRTDVSSRDERTGRTRRTYDRQQRYRR